MGHYEVEPQPAEAVRAPAARASRADSPVPLLQLQAAAGNAAVAALVEQQEREAGEQVRGVLGSEGRPLDDGIRAEAEGHLGADLGHVCVHDDSAAAASAKAVQAQAYTSGSHVVFGEGKYDPGSSEGRQRLAHELTHVVQQQAGPVDGTATAGGLSISDPADPFEQAADEAASSFVQRTPLQREDDEDEDAGLRLQREEDEDEEDVQLQREDDEDDEDALGAG